MNGLNNLEHDVITILRNKSQAIAAYDKYISDTPDQGNAEARRRFEEFTRLDWKDVEKPREVLTNVLSKAAAGDGPR